MFANKFISNQCLYFHGYQQATHREDEGSDFPEFNGQLFAISTGHKIIFIMGE